MNGPALVTSKMAKHLTRLLGIDHGEAFTAAQLDNAFVPQLGLTWRDIIVPETVDGGQQGRCALSGRTCSKNPSVILPITICAGRRMPTVLQLEWLEIIDQCRWRPESAQRWRSGGMTTSAGAGA
jgi:hypothetical protein